MPHRTPSLRPLCRLPGGRRRIRRLAGLPLLAFFTLTLTLMLGACTPPDAQVTDAGVDQTVLPLGAVRLTLGPLTLGPAEESTRCITAHLPTTIPTDVIEIDSTLQLTHHVIFYREGVDRPDNPLHPCPPLDVLSGTNPSRAPLYIGEVPQEQFRLPPGVGYRLGAGQAYTIEGHFLNASSKTVQATAELVLIPTPAGVEVKQADMLFLSATSQLGKKYDGVGSGLPPAVGSVPTKTTLEPAFFGLPDDLTVDVNYFGLTSHQHHFGTHFTIAKSSSLSDSGTPLYENSDWEHPPLQRFDDPPLRFGFGEGFRWVCSYENPTAKYVTFGSSAVTNEMCILWAYYYPSIGFRVYFQ